MFPQLNISAAEITQRCLATTENDIEKILTKSRLDFFALLALLSPAARTLMPLLRQHAQILRQRYFGKTVTIYAPLYISNYCVNSCAYCDFNVRHHTPRKILSLSEIATEAEAIRDRGIDALLIVASENPNKLTLDYLCAIGEMLREKFSYLALEIASQNEEDYRRLFHAGFSGLTLFQETYDENLYRELHPQGPKNNYEFRLHSQLRAGRAGMRTLGMAFLLGLADWRLEAANLAAHAWFLQKECWQSKIQFAFPRLTPIGGGFQPRVNIDENDLEQIMLAFRIVFPECGMTVSTRENAAFRDKIVITCADNMSAGSKVTPGGYAIDASNEIGQFTVNDERSVAEIAAAIQQNGQQVVRKMWDKIL